MSDCLSERGGIRSSNKKYLSAFAEFAVRNLSDGVYLIDRDAAIVYVNKAACEQVGYSEEELLNMRIMDIDSSVRGDVWDSVWEITEKEKFQTIETEHQRKDGSRFPVEVLANHLVIEGEQYSCSFTRDLTSRREMEAKIRQAEKMEAIGQLAGGIAHDFNNQLVGVLGYADLMKQELAGNEKFEKYLDSIILAARRSADLISQLLAFASRGKYLTVQIDIRKLIDETIRILERSIDKNIVIKTCYQAGSMLTTGDPAQLGNALLNLAINARDAMPSGGVLTFSVSKVFLDGNFQPGRLIDFFPGDFLRISVADTGTGISETDLARIFEPFFTTKEKGKGTGMGLASVYGTVKNHSGTLEVKSLPGRGTEMILFLPVSPEAGIQDISGIDQHEPQGKFSAHVLLVDDEEIVREGTKRMLKKIGCRVTTVDNGNRAVEFYKESADEIDVIILDQCMPGLSGMEVLKTLRSLGVKLPVIISSGFSLEADVKEMMADGAVVFLQKPYRIEELAEKLNTVLLLVKNFC